jgi:hypothetical protein
MALTIFPPMEKQTAADQTKPIASVTLPAQSLVSDVLCRWKMEPRERTNLDEERMGHTSWALEVDRGFSRQRFIPRRI